ncbi:MAG: T9SS type A sorting domain-containing protein [Candidatus Kapabacteria bacterium]|nr:T9SS type A sorting domain-containing protein [Candidatus Kapabacteria bacterium]
MKLKLFLYLAVLLCLAHTLALAGSINDTVWTKRFKDGIGNMSFTSDGSQLMIPTGDSLFLLDGKTGSVLKSYEWGIGYYHHFINNEKNCIYFSNTDSSFHIRDLSNGVELRKIYCPESSYFSTCSYTPDAKYAIITTNLPFNSGVDNFIPVGLTWKVLDLETGEIKHQKSYPLKPKFSGVDVQKVFLSATGDTAIVQINRSYGDGVGHWTYWLGIVGYDVRTGDSLFVFPRYGNPYQISTGFCIVFANENKCSIVDDNGLSIKNDIEVDLTSFRDITVDNTNQYIAIGKNGLRYGLNILQTLNSKSVFSVPKIGVDGVIFSPYDNTKVIVYAGNGCSLYNIDLETSVIDNTGGNILYPNPTTGLLNLKYSMMVSGIASYTISTIQGKVLLNADLDEQDAGVHDLLIPISELPSGTYLLRLITPTENSTYRFTTIR